MVKVDYQGCVGVGNLISFEAVINKYPANWINFPENAKGDKRKAATAEMNHSFYSKVHCNFRKYIREYNSCCLLCCGDSIIPFMVEYLAGFCYTFKVFNHGKDNYFKQNQLLHDYYKQIRLSQKDVIAWFVGDVCRLGGKYNFTVNTKLLVKSLVERVEQLYSEDPDKLKENK